MLADLRTELLQTPASKFPEDVRAVPSSELLEFAMGISKYSVPPTYREVVPKGDEEDKEKETEKEKDKEDGGSSGIPTPGVNTPITTTIPPTNALPGVSTSADADKAADAPAEGDNAEKKEPTPTQAAWLLEHKQKGLSWTPWPDENKIRNGNLMRVQHMLDQKKDPWTDKVPTMKELEDKAKEIADAERKRVEEEEERERERVEREKQRGEVGGERPREERVVQQFTGFEFDEDDE